jgi:hypothetical protein
MAKVALFYAEEIPAKWYVAPKPMNGKIHPIATGTQQKSPTFL